MAPKRKKTSGKQHNESHQDRSGPSSSSSLIPPAESDYMFMYGQQPGNYTDDMPQSRIGGSRDRRKVFVESVPDVVHEHDCLRAITDLDWDGFGMTEAQQQMHQLCLLSYHSHAVHPLTLHVKEHTEFFKAKIAQLQADLAAFEILWQEQSGIHKNMAKNARRSSPQQLNLMQDKLAECNLTQDALLFKHDGLERRLESLEATIMYGKDYRVQVAQANNSFNCIEARIAAAQVVATYRNTPNPSVCNSCAASQACSEADSVASKGVQS